MKVLVLTRSALNNDDNMGNTIGSLFGNSDQIELHSLYMRAGKYHNNICKTVYQISEQKLIKSIFNRYQCGEEINTNITEIDEERYEKKIYDFAKSFNFYFLWFLRELIWVFGFWKTQNLKDYLNKIKPDIVFMPSFNCWYPYKVLSYVMQFSNAKLVLYHADDNYSLKQFHISPFYWLYRIILREYIRSSVKKSDLNFCISTLQLSEYEKYFQVKCYLLQKVSKSVDNPKIELITHQPIRMIYTGNISSGRWTTLALVGRVLKKINEDGIKVQLYIYSATKLTRRMKKALVIDDCIKFMGSVPSYEIPNIQSNADILVHAESFWVKDVLEVRFSFSTKIIDYLSKGKCILAVGPSSVSSIQYFITNEIGYVFSDKKLIDQQLTQLLSNKNEMFISANKTWDFYKLNHNMGNIRNQLYGKLYEIYK